MQFLAWTYGTSVTSNTFSGNNQGINVFGSDNNTFSGNDFVNNGIGLFLECNPGGTGYKPDNNKISTTTISWVMAYRLIYVTRITVLILICQMVVITGATGRHLNIEPDGIVDIPYEVRDSYTQYDPYYDNLPWTIPTDWRDVTLKAKMIISVINGLDSSVFKKLEDRDKLTEKLNKTIEKLEKGKHKEARKKLKKEVLKMIDGCAKKRNPDKDDKIIDCDAQAEVYPLVLEAITLLE